jgi:hypothetical protein
MIGILLVVVILGILAAVVLAVQSSPSTKSAGTAPQGTTTTIPQSIGSAAQEGAVSACEADYQTVNAAVLTYRTLKGVDPSAGTSWATAASSGGALLTSWPSDPQYYSIVWNGTVLSVVPAKGTPSHGSIGTKSPPTGCFAA